MGRPTPLGAPARPAGPTTRGALAAVLGLALGLEASACTPQAEPAVQDVSPPARSDAPAAQDDASPRRPARRRALDGLAGFVSRSKVRYDVLPETPYLLEATYVFPERSRWLLEPWRAETERSQETESADRRQRNLRFQYGEAVWAIEPLKLASRTFGGEEQRIARLQLELRRVAMVWPAEHEWVAEGDERTTTVAGLGVLVATLGANDRPTRLESRDLDGRLRERLANIVWRAPESEGARSWPASWDFHFGEKRVWRETIESTKPAGKVSELLFLPPDRRGPGARVSLPPGATQRLELPATATWSEALDEDARATWPLALAAGRRALARWEAELGAERLEPRPVFHLDAEGRPRRIELRLRAVPESLPEGWGRSAPSTAVRRILPGLAGVDAAAIAALGKGLEPDERPGPAHLVVQLVGDGAGLTQLYVPVLRRP